MLCKKMLIEAVTVCVNYSDFLAEAIPHNLPLLDLWTIVTTHEDRATQALCAKHGIHCLMTDVFYRDVEKPRINKSRGINYGLMHHGQAGWMLHLDADIVLPPQFRRMLENADLDEACLYGMDRVDCPDSAAWDKYLANPHQQYQWRYLLIPPPWKLGARIAHGDFAGYVPPGFFQLWHPGKSGVTRYPIKVEGDMEHTDVLHAVQWERRKRILIPEGWCIHLSSAGEFGANWRGRKTPPFRPAAATPPPQAPSYS
jgi:hypothetical protein